VGRRDKRKRRQKKIARRNTEVLKLITNPKRNAGPHHNRNHDVEKGLSRKPKHKSDLEPQD